MVSGEIIFLELFPKGTYRALSQDACRLPGRLHIRTVSQMSPSEFPSPAHATARSELLSEFPLDLPSAAHTTARSELPSEFPSQCTAND